MTLHASGRWRCTIGRVLSPRSGKLVDKDWYFGGTQAEAIQKATAKARQWEPLCANWDRTERGALEVIGQPFPGEPRWPDKPTANGDSTRADAVAQARDGGLLDWDALGRAYAEFSFSELIRVYEEDRRDDLRSQDVRNSTIAKDLSQMRQAAGYLPADLPMVQLNAEHFRQAKSRMLESGKSRRTVRNYLSAAVKLLKWVYGRYGGSEARMPAGIEEAIALRGVVRTSITVHGAAELAELIKHLKGSISQLDCMLALNCGMYPADIGRLRLDEIDLKEGSILWDREKEPDNTFRIHHVLWPETMTLLRRYLNDGSIDGLFLDYRFGRDRPLKIDARELAFLDRGRPRYLTKPAGSPNDRVGKAWRSAQTGIEFHNLRKSASELLVAAVTTRGSTGELEAIGEIRDRFLGHKDAQLVRLYQTHRKGVYQRMNHYLALVGEQLRRSGVFAHVG